MTKRPDSLEGSTFEIKTKCGKMYCTFNTDGDKVVEVFFRLGRQGSCARTWTSFVGKFITHHLRKGADIRRLLKHLDATDHECAGVYGDEKSCPNAMAIALRKGLGIEEEKDV